jgi:hypothetical protein
MAFLYFFFQPVYNSHHSERLGSVHTYNSWLKRKTKPKTADREMEKLKKKEESYC